LIGSGGCGHRALRPQTRHTGQYADKEKYNGIKKSHADATGRLGLITHKVS
jgi:hypothetical protein